MKRIYLLLVLFANAIFCYKAVIVCPVADLVTEPIEPFTLPVAPVNFRDGISCPRLHQALANEVIEVVEEKNNNVKVKALNCFFQTNGSNTKHSTYWTQKTNFVPVSKVNANLLPEPINFENKKQNQQSKPTIVLTKPFYCKQTKQTFSAGTRFVTIGNLAQVLNPKNLKFISVKIPSEYYLQEKSRSKEEMLNIFCKTLESWATEEYIPYVWGGISFASLCGRKFKKETKGLRRFYTVEKCNQTVKTGFDCSNVILRAAQIAGMPFYFKNTYTIGQNLKLVEPSKPIPNCAIIIWPGHVIVLTDAKNGTIVEAGDYSYGWGRLHKVKIKDFFKGLKTAKELQNAYNKEKPLLRKNPKGEVVQTIKSFNVYYPI